jgi:hypothetical protein
MQFPGLGDEFAQFAYQVIGTQLSFASLDSASDCEE